MKKPTPILQKASEYVFNLLREKLPANHIYHNYTHTTDVVNAVSEIADGMEFSKEDTETVLLAAWFHDTGFIEAYEGHEDHSKEIATRWLKENLYPEDRIQKIMGCIEATRYPQQPKNLLEYVICDADLSGISSKKYFEKAKFLRREMELVLDKVLSDHDWYQTEIDFLTRHKYHTPYAHLNYDKRKNEHVLELREMLRQGEEADSKKVQKKQEKDTEKAEKEKRPDRGIETMFRLTITNHMDLSKMADDKANFLLSINGIIVSFAIANLLSKLDVNRYLILPTIMLVTVCLASIIFAILSTRPKVSEGKFTKEDIQQKRVNLLFFGNFYNMSLPDFNWGFNEMMKDREFLYGSMIKDLYFLGKVLGKKYRLVRISYTIFMWGLIVTVIAYAASIWYYFSYLSSLDMTTPLQSSTGG